MTSSRSESKNLVVTQSETQGLSVLDNSQVSCAVETNRWHSRGGLDLFCLLIINKTTATRWPIRTAKVMDEDTKWPRAFLWFNITSGTSVRRPFTQFFIQVFKQISNVG